MRSCDVMWRSCEIMWMSIMMSCDSKCIHLYMFDSQIVFFCRMPLL